MAFYKVVIEAKAEKEIRKLSKPIRVRVRLAIDELETSPRPSASRKMVGSAGYRLRVGDYRIIYEIEDKMVMIFIIKVGHRREVYRK